MKAVKNTATNCKALAGIPALCKELQETILSSLKEIQEAGKELEANKDKLGDIKKKCEAEKKTEACECYLLCGKPIVCSADDKKKWSASNKKAKAKAKAKAIGKGKGADKVKAKGKANK